MDFSWVTKTTKHCFEIFFMMFITSTVFLLSRFPVGSSAIIILGLLTNALAIATRCCCPPLNWLALRFRKLYIPTCFNI